MYIMCINYIHSMGIHMHINLSTEIEQYLQDKVSAGYYGNASEVVRDAIRRMREEDEKLKALRAAIHIGDEQIDRGQGIPYTQERLNAITQKAFANARNGKKINRDVVK